MTTTTTTDLQKQLRGFKMKIKVPEAITLITDRMSKKMKFIKYTVTKPIDFLNSIAQKRISTKQSKKIERYRTLTSVA